MIGQMRHLFALLAFIGLLISPATAAAATAACAEMGPHEMMAMPMADGSQQEPGDDAHPCCEDKAPNPKSDKDCIQACVSMCAVAVVLPAPLMLVVAPPRAAPEPQAVAQPRPHSPPRAERPPRSVA